MKTNKAVQLAALMGLASIGLTDDAPKLKTRSATGKPRYQHKQKKARWAIARKSRKVNARIRRS